MSKVIQHNFFIKYLHTKSVECDWGSMVEWTSFIKTDQFVSSISFRLNDECKKEEKLITAAR